MYKILSNRCWYFAGGLVNNYKLTNNKWLKIGGEKSNYITEEYNKLINSENIVSFLVCGSEYFIFIKTKNNIKVYKLGSLFVRKLKSVSLEESKKLGYEVNKINNIKVDLHNHILYKKIFSSMYKIDIKIV